jgi:flagellar protein FliS
MLGRNKALSQYAGVATTAENASPHRLVQMLMEGVLDKISIAKGLMDRKDFGGKSQQISLAMSIIMTLRNSLDMSAGGEIAVNLNDLYGYMYNRLVDANTYNDISALEEVASLLKEIKSAWDAMPAEIQSAPRQNLAGQAAVAR